MNITVIDGYGANPGDLSWKAFERFGQLSVYDRTEPHELADRVATSDIVISNKIVWNADAFDAASHLELLALTSTGYNTVDLDEARKRGITVCNVPAYSTASVAQLTFSLILELANHVGRHSDDIAEGRWCESVDFCYFDTPQMELSGKCLGIIGMGSIGTAVARIARAFDMEVVFFNRRPKPQCEDAHTRQVSLNELFEVSDIVSLHCPATSETNGLMNAERIARMKTGSFLVNTARGTLVDESAVAEALESGQLAGFAADVVSVEPMRDDNPLLGMRNAIITPHMAWASVEARTRLMHAVEENIAGYLSGNPRNVLN